MGEILKDLFRSYYLKEEEKLFLRQMSPSFPIEREMIYYLSK